MLKVWQWFWFLLDRTCGSDGAAAGQILPGQGLCRSENVVSQKGLFPIQQHPTVSEQLKISNQKERNHGDEINGSYLILFSSSITRAKGLSILYSLHLPVLLFHPCLPLLMLSASFFICSFLLSFVLSITSTSRRICKAKSLQIFHFLTYILVSGVCTVYVLAHINPCKMNVRPASDFNCSLRVTQQVTSSCSPPF